MSFSGDLAPLAALGFGQLPVDCRAGFGSVAVMVVEERPPAMVTDVRTGRENVTE